MKGIGLSDYWKRILNNYIEFGNDYGMHANVNRHNLNEAEAYLYQTCLLIRLMMRIKQASI